MTAEFIPAYVAPEPGEGALDPIFSCLADTTEALNKQAALHLETFDDAATAALLLDRIRNARQTLQTLEAAVESTTAQRMPGKTLTFPGYMVERKGGTKSHKWRDADVAWAALVPLATDGSGTVDDAAAELIGQVRDRLLECASISYWRIEALKAVGVDPYAFRTSVVGRHTIQIIRTEDLRP